jgi:serine/threonine protein kinase/Flp pilus assembly protein TadD
VSERSELEASPSRPPEALTQVLVRRGRSRREGQSSGTAVGSTLPDVGTELLGFRLLRELGRGSFARVFLAEQADLAGRLIVLKVSRMAGDEPQTLAQLQHTNIVPIYSVHDDPQGGLRAFSMPYFGGASLSAVLTRLWADVPRPTQGAQLRSALEAFRAPGPPSPPSGEGRAAEGAGPDAPDRPPGPAWAGLTYVRAVAWIVARLAEALQHAHQRGVLHRDIKPSNVLLGEDGQPMLLDFNVAQREGDEKAAALLGGTVAYMAPEHLRALAQRDLSQARTVDRRSDVYSLGMVLYELLVGVRPFDQSASYSAELPELAAMAVERAAAVPSARHMRADVPWGLESILRRCLAPAPEDRYQQAGELTEDLQRFLEDRPLRHAPELSTKEVVRKWARRHPRLTSSASVAAAAVVLLLLAGGALAGVRHHLSAVQTELEDIQARERHKAYRDGTARALCLVNTTTGRPEHVREGLAVCEQTLGLYNLLAEEHWQEPPDWARLGPAARAEVAEDARELLLLLAWARARNAPGDAGVLRANLGLLDRAEQIEGLAPSAALCEDRAIYLDELGDKAGAAAARKKAAGLKPASARDHYLLATSYARAKQFALAVTQLDEALRLCPQHYWSLLQRGICHLERKDHLLAVADFSVCIGLWPDLPWGYFNRAYCLEQQGDREKAIDDYTAALARDGGLLAAYRNRGMTRVELRRYAEALADLDRAVSPGQKDAAVLAGRGVALEGLRRHSDADEAFREAHALARRGPAEDRARIRWVYAFAVADRLPDESLRAFDDVLRHRPGHPEALYGRGMLLTRRGREGEAIAAFGEALKSAPGFLEPRRFRAVLLARAGRFEPAWRDIAACLERAPEHGPTLYAAACVAALEAEKAGQGPAARMAADRAAAYLRRAFQRGYGREQAATDRDLAGARGHPEVARLLRGQ